MANNKFQKNSKFKTLNSKLNVVFMGTPKIATEILEQLISSNIPISAVFTRLDKPRGRDSQISESEVKVLAKKYSIPVYQPATKEDLSKNLRVVNPDLAIVVAYGMILPKEAINVPKLGILNIHYSLLPQYRGAAPYMESILNGDKKTGVTIMKMAEGLDEGDIIAQKEVVLSGDETSPELLKKLTKVGAKMLTEVMPKWVKDEIKTQKQTGTPTYSKLVKKDDGQIDWANDGAIKIERKSRAYQPWPGVYSFWNGKKIDFYDIEITNDQVEPGKVVVRNDQIVIGTKKDSISPKYLKIEGRRKITSEEFLRGYPDFRNASL